MGNGLIVALNPPTQAGNLPAQRELAILIGVFCRELRLRRVPPRGGGEFTIRAFFRCQTHTDEFADAALFHRHAI